MVSEVKVLEITVGMRVMGSVCKGGVGRTVAAIGEKWIYISNHKWRGDLNDIAFKIQKKDAFVHVGQGAVVVPGEGTYHVESLNLSSNVSERMPITVSKRKDIDITK